jgi:flagella basal body P-ring formation protein FlgA
VGGEELVAAVREHVAAVRHLGAESLSVQPTGVLPPSVAVPDGRVELRVRTRPGAELAGTVSPTVDVWVDGVLARSVSVPVRIGILGDVLVAARALGRGHPLTPEDVRIERRDVTGPQDPLRELADIEGRITVRPIAQGESMLPSLLERPPLVRRGDIVLVTAEGRGLRVTAQGEAKQDGKSGDVIRVRNLTSNRDVIGQVDGERSVRVQF